MTYLSDRSAAKFRWFKSHEESVTDATPKVLGMTQNPADSIPLTESPQGIGVVAGLGIGMALATFIVAIGFAGSRYSYRWSSDVYWMGQVALYGIPAGFLILRRVVLKAEALAIAFLMPASTYLVLECYSPGKFKFLDEFQHVQTAQSILATHHLFHTNTVLPISPQYPGLEIITTSLVSLTHISITAAGLVVAGVAHVLFGLGIYYLVVEASNRPRVAALAVVIYATGYHYQFFDSYFIYQTIALPFLILSLLATVKMLKSRGKVAFVWGVAAVACGAVVAVSHHITSYALIAFLFCFAIAQFLLPRSVRHRGLFWVIVATVAIIAFWELRIATDTFNYIKPVIQSLIGGAPKAKPATPITHGTAGTPGRGDTIAEYAGILFLVGLTVLGLWRVWRARAAMTSPAMLAMLIGSLGLFLVFSSRVVSANGAELTGRALTFVLIPVSVVCASAILGPINTFKEVNLERRRKRLRTSVFGLASTGLVIVLAVAGIAGGWPPYYARLPGPFLVDAWERSTDQHNIAASQWVVDELPPDYGIASDIFTEGILSSLGHQADALIVAQLFESPDYTEADREFVRTYQISFVAVDRRITEQTPADGVYFSNDPVGFYSKPIPKANVSKFDRIPGVSLIFSDGTISIYELIGS
jgi:hypothetical protein